MLLKLWFVLSTGWPKWIHWNFLKRLSTNVLLKFSLLFLPVCIVVTYKESLNLELLFLKWGATFIHHLVSDHSFIHIFMLVQAMLLIWEHLSLIFWSNEESTLKKLLKKESIFELHALLHWLRLWELCNKLTNF